MSRFEDIYEFRRATVNDVDRIMEFIRKEWKSNHIFALDREFFCFEHQNGEQFNFILAIDRETNEIAGLQGFIPYSDDENSKRFAVSGVIIKVKVPSKLPCLGVEIMKKVAQLVPYKYYCAVGVNPKTCLPLTKHYMKRYIGALQHYYQLNPCFTEFHTAKITNKIDLRISEENHVRLRHLNTIDEADYDFNKYFSNLPHKDKWYINKRYFSHPIYQYKIMDVVDGEGISQGLLIGREVSSGRSKVFRIVDFVGDIEIIAGIGPDIQQMMIEKQYEYVDFLCEGIAEEAMQKAGFVLNRSDSGNIIPNYFEPFVQENITIWYEKSEETMALFKADGDQDRPNYR